MKRLLAACCLLLSTATFTWSQATIDFTTYTGGNTFVNDWVLTMSLSGDGSVVLSDTAGLVSNGVSVSGTVGTGVTGDFTFTFDGITNGGGDTQVQLRPSGLGVQGRNSGRIDWNADDGDSQSEALDVIVDTTNLLAGSSLILTELAVGNYNGTPVLGPVIEDFNEVVTTAGVGDTNVTLGGAGFTIDSGLSDTFILSSSDAAGGGLQGFSLQTLTFDFGDTPMLEVFVSRETGDVTLVNTSGQDFDIAGLSILSGTGSLVAGNWRSVTENYDAGGGDGGNGSLDSDDEWILFSETASDLSEGTLGTTTIEDGSAISFGSVFNTAGSEDIAFEYLDADSGDVFSLNPSYVDASTGDLLGDFNNDGSVDAADYTVARDNLGSADDSVLNGNGDGVPGVTLGDLDLWASNFGQTSSAIAAPEPGAAALLTLVITFSKLSSRLHSSENV